MIENIIITIKKCTTFDKGWALVAPYQSVFSRNRKFCALNVSDIVRAITKSTRVNLILSEPCLSSQIVKELEWVNKYVSFNLIAKDQDVADRYAKLKFDKIIIDKGIDFNYISVKGATYLNALISEDYVAVDDSLNRAFFEGVKFDIKYDFIKCAKFVLFVDENNDKDYSEMLEACLKAKIPTEYLVGTKVYSQKLVHKFKGINATLLCSDKANNGILYSTQDGRLYCVNLTSKCIVSSEIESANYYLGSPYRCLKCGDIVDVNKIPSGSFTCDRGVITPLKIVKEKIIERTVQIDEMEDFVAEKFDKSETDGYNQYCTEAGEVVYNFTLVPPIFKTDKISNIYADVETIYANWRDDLTTIKLSEVVSYLKDLELSESGLCMLCEEIIGFDKRLNEIIKKHNYKTYYVEVSNLTELVNYSTTKDYCKELFLKVNSESSGTKFDKFDVEIAGYKQTIEEKKVLIDKGIEVLSNKRRVEILEKKIADLTVMKQRFSGSAAVRDNKQLDAFLTLCKQVVEGKFVEEKREVDSIGNVLAAKEASKIARLELFVKTYLYEFNQFIISVKDILRQFKTIDIPTDYIVYEQDGKRVIAIESEQEFYDTENVRKHFNLHCRARR